MGYIVEWVKGVRETNEVVDETLGNISEAVIEGACSLRAKYPKALRGGGILTPVMDRLCSENGHPIPDSPPARPWTGGQKAGRNYVVSWTQHLTKTPGCTRINQSSGSQTLVGPISGVQIELISPNPIYNYGCYGLGNQDICSSNVLIAHGNNQKHYIYVNTGSWCAVGLRPMLSEVKITSVTRADGLPNDSEDIGDTDQAEYPDDPAYNPDDGVRSVEICGTPADAEDQRCVTVDIDFDPFLDENGNQCFTIEGQKYCFTPDGVEKQDDEPTSPETPSPDELDPAVEEDKEESSEEDESIVYVTTEITTLPSSGKSVFHSGTGNNDYFAGYFNWTTSTSSGVYRYPSVPIRKQMQIYFKPEEATGYSTYTVNGAKIKVVKYKKPPEEEEDGD